MERRQTEKKKDQANGSTSPERRRAAGEATGPAMRGGQPGAIAMHGGGAAAPWRQQQRRRGGAGTLAERCALANGRRSPCLIACCSDDALHTSGRRCRPPARTGVPAAGTRCAAGHTELRCMAVTTVQVRGCQGRAEARVSAATGWCRCLSLQRLALVLRCCSPVCQSSSPLICRGIAGSTAVVSSQCELACAHKLLCPLHSSERSPPAGRLGPSRVRGGM